MNLLSPTDLISASTDRRAQQIAELNTVLAQALGDPLDLDLIEEAMYLMAEIAVLTRGAYQLHYRALFV